MNIVGIRHNNSDRFSPKASSTSTEIPMTREDNWIPRCIKFSVFFMNSLYWFFAMFTMGVGLHVQVDQMQPMGKLVNPLVSPAFILISMGGLLFLTATFGCVGSLRENLCLLRTYLVVLLFLLMVHVALGAVSFIVLFSNTSVDAGAEELLHTAIIRFRDDQRLADYISYLQSTLQCCGVSGFRDWSNNPYFQCAEYNVNAEKCGVPPSCCKFVAMEQVNLMCGYGTTNSTLTMREASSSVYTKGCLVKVEEILQSVAITLGVVAFGVAVPLLCGVLLCGRMIRCLEKNIRFYIQNNYHSKDPFYIPGGSIYHVTEPRRIPFIKKLPVN